MRLRFTEELKIALVTCAIVLCLAGVMEIHDRYSTTGIASWYGKRFRGKKTASGEIFDPEKFSAAHRRLPLGTVVKVTDMKTRRAVVVVINDRGPYIPGRIIDLSRAAARQLDMLKKGLAPVKIEVLEHAPR